jgi:hypothetical protein
MPLDDATGGVADGALDSRGLTEATAGWRVRLFI